MTKIYRLGVFIVVLSLLLCASIGAGDELCQNEGFETWTGGNPNPWTLAPGVTGLTVTQETTQIHSGTSSAELEKTTSGRKDFHQVISVNASADYTFSAYILDNNPQIRVRLWISWRDSGGTFISSEGPGTYTSDSGDWQPQTYGPVTSPANAAQVWFQIRMYDVGGFVSASSVYADDASCQGPGGDTTPPSDKLIRVVDDDTIEITFTEDVEQASAETTTNYTVDGGVGNPSSATRDATDHSKVTLDFASALPTTSKLTITINGVKDLSNNPTSNLTAEFLAGIRAPGDVDDVNTPNGDQVYTDVYVTVRGIVTATEFQTQNLTMAGVSSSDGIEVRNNAGNITGIARGDKVIVAGKIGQYNGLAQIQGGPPYYVVEQAGVGEPSPQEVSVNVVSNVDEEGSNAFCGEAYEGNLVEIKGAIIGNTMGNSRTGGDPDSDGLFDGDANYQISVSGATGVMRIDASTNIVGTSIYYGGLDIRGIVMQYDYSTPFNSAYSIYPRDVNDFSGATGVSSNWALYE